MRGSAYRVAFLVLLALAPLGRAESQIFDPETRLEAALAQYANALEEKNRDARLAIFAQAEHGFASVADAGSHNAALQINLGNAALQAEHMGQAVLAYRRALRLDPEASTARQNLVHVRSLLPIWVPRPSPSEGVEALLFYRRVPSTLRIDLAAGCFLVLSIGFAISIRRPNGGWRGIAFVAGIAWLLILASVLFDSGGQKANAAVVMTDETLARSADSRLSALALPEPLPAGTEVEILEERAEWARIRLHNGRNVWVRESSVMRVAP